MRYLIIRRKVKILLAFLLPVVILLTVLPGVYSYLSISKQDTLLTRREISEILDLPGDIGRVEGKENISISSHFFNNDRAIVYLNIDSLNLKGALVSADIFVKGRFIRNSSEKVGGFSGELSFKNIMINSEPFSRPISASFKIVNDELAIESLRVGESYELKGRLGLIEPYKVDLDFYIVRADIRDFTLMVRANNPEVNLGVINGMFHVKGDLSNLFSEGVLESKNGIIGSVGYDSAMIKLEGYGPVINIVDSRIKQGKGTLTIDGYLDLRNIVRGGLFEGITVRSDMKTVVWNGWDINREGQDELSMSKGISDNFRIGFKTMAKEPLTTYYEREDTEEVSLEYNLKGKENLKLKLKDNEEFFGIEHNIKF